MKRTALVFCTIYAALSVFAQQPTIMKVTANGVSFNMIEVQGGRFNMGGTAEQYGSDDSEFPIHVVKLDDFFIGETEVTQALWEAVMENNPSGFQGDGNLPVERVTWDECQDFVSKLKTITGIDFRLPTESEWEYAARGGNKSCYTQYSGSADINEVAWYGNNSGNTTHPVAQLKPNELGIYDMSGNVFEWCQDFYGDYDMMPVEAPTGPKEGENRVRRGGAYNGTTKGPRVAFRNYELQDIRFNYIGVRLAASNMNTVSSIVSPVKNEENTDNSILYNVQGQQINENHKGIVIEDGVKRISK